MLTRKQRIADLRRAVTEKEKKINVLSHRVQAEQAATLQDTKRQQCVADPSSVPARKLTCKDFKKMAGKSIERTPLDRLLGAVDVEQSSGLGQRFPTEVNFRFGNVNCMLMLIPTSSRLVSHHVKVMNICKRKY